jgi:hypothetical protein
MEPKRPGDGTLRPRGRRKPQRRGGKAIVVWASVAGAVVIAAVAVIVAVQVVKERRTDPRLYGTWKSDTDATIAEMRKTRPVTDDQEQKLRMLFGKMKVTYTATTVTSDLDGTVETQPYQVVSKDATSVQIKSPSPLLKKDEVFRIRFVGPDTHWIDEPHFQVSECFRRID